MSVLDSPNGVAFADGANTAYVGGWIGITVAPLVPRKAPGGGIEALPGTNVTIKNSLVMGNLAMPSHAVTSILTTCSATTMCHTSDGDGGGIDDWVTMTVIDSQVSDNRATGINADGGGIVVERNASLSLQFRLAARERIAALSVRLVVSVSRKRSSLPAGV